MCSTEVFPARAQPPLGSWSSILGCSTECLRRCASSSIITSAATTALGPASSEQIRGRLTAGSERAGSIERGCSRSAAPSATCHGQRPILHPAAAAAILSGPMPGLSPARLRRHRGDPPHRPVPPLHIEAAGRRPNLREAALQCAACLRHRRPGPGLTVPWRRTPLCCQLEPPPGAPSFRSPG
jgi:hypothetical protein